MDNDDAFAPKPAQPKSWSELFEITKGLRAVPMAEIERGRADWHYQFGNKDMRKCGRLHCEQKHGDGWLIALPGKRFVHVGHICARSAAQDVAAWDRKLSAHEDERKANARLKAAEEAIAAAAVAHAFAESEVVKSIRAMHTDFCNQARGSLLVALQERGRIGRADIERDRRLTDNEIDVERMRLSRGFDDTRHIQVNRLVRERIGSLVGIEAFAPGKDVESCADQLLRLAARLRRVNAAVLTNQQVKHLHQDTRELGPLRASLTAAIAATQRFYTTDNLRNLMMLEETRRGGIVEIKMTDQYSVLVRRRNGY